MRNRLMPAFGRLRLDTIDHARVSAWFDAASVNRPGVANRAFETLRAMLAAARQWGELGENVPDACANIVMNARRPVAALPRRDEAARVFPEDLTPARLYTFWVGVREEAGLPGVRIHDARHTYASQGVMNGVGLTAVGKLLGHRKRTTTAIYAHLDDTALRDAAAHVATVIARAMGYEAELPPLRDETRNRDTPTALPEFAKPSAPAAADGPRTPLWLKSANGRLEEKRQKRGPEDRSVNPKVDRPMTGSAGSSRSVKPSGKGEPRRSRGPIKI